MWRQSNFQENPDSDLSISDDEELDGSFPGACVSVGGRDEEEKEEGLRLQNRLETLTGAVRSYGRKNEYSSGHNSTKQASSYLEDDVEVPDSPCKTDDVFSRTTFKCIPNEEVISDDENGTAFDHFSKEENKVLSKVPDAPGAVSNHDGFGTGKKVGINAWSMISKEAEALLHLNRHVSCSSLQAHCKADRSCAKSKGMSRFLFRFQSHKRVSWPSTSKEENDLSSKVHEVSEKSRTIDADVHPIAQLSEGASQEREKQLEIVPAELEALTHELSGQSMAEILDNLKANTSHLRKNFQMQNGMRGKTEQLAIRKSLHSLGNPMLDGEDCLETMDDGFSSDEEAHDGDMKLAIPEKKWTMAERFQEALGASYEEALVAVPKSLGIGLFGKLQQLMEREKEMDALFLKMSKVHAGSSDESAFIHVKIISRYLDAKLTVCHCSLVEAIKSHENLVRMENEGDKRTVIFSPRICGNVDLEIGNLIRIYHPWKEVEATGCSEKIVLSPYFSQISA